MKKALFIAVCLVLCVCFCLGGCAAEYDADADYAVPEEEVITEEAAVEEESSASGIGDIGSVTVSQDETRKLQYTLFLSIDTNEFDKDYAKIISEMRRSGGYVEYESLSGSETSSYGRYGRFISLTLRIPVENYEDFASSISKVGNITSKETTTQDLTENYYDLESRIELLEERKQRLMGHLQQATKMDDIIMLEDEISDVIYELESLEGSKRGIEKKTEYATVDISMSEYLNADSITQQDKLTNAGDAFNMTLKGMGEFFEVFGLGLAAAAPVLILIAAIAVGTVFAVKGIKKLLRKIKNSKKQS